MAQKKKPAGKVGTRVRKTISEPPKSQVLPAKTSVAAEIPTAAFRRLHYMYGAVTQIELNNFLLGNSIDNDERQREIKAQWRGAAEVFSEIVRTETGVADSVAAQPLGAA